MPLSLFCILQFYPFGKFLKSFLIWIKIIGAHLWYNTRQWSRFPLQVLTRCAGCGLSTSIGAKGSTYIVPVHLELTKNYTPFILQTMVYAVPNLVNFSDKNKHRFCATLCYEWMTFCVRDWSGKPTAMTQEWRGLGTKSPTRRETPKNSKYI